MRLFRSPISWNGWLFLVGTLCLLVGACGQRSGVEGSEGTTSEEGQEGGEQALSVALPFQVRGDAEGLLLVWLDEEGAHSASSRSGIPEARRALVRVQSLRPEHAGDIGTDQIYVADLRQAEGDGTYPVRVMDREDFERAAAQLRPADVEEPPSDLGLENAQVVLFGTSWCGVCATARRHLRARNVAFVDLDIERDAGAREAMLQRAQRAGVQPRGVPVIAVGDQLFTGFDARSIDRALARLGTAI